jgi:hypothetical protein
MFALSKLVVLSSIPAMLVSAAPFTKRALLTGSGDASVHTEYATMTGTTTTGACGYPANSISGMTHVMALEGSAASGPLDKVIVLSAIVLF